MRIGWSELLVILILAFLLFGTQRVSGLGKALGKSVREFKEEVAPQDKEKDVKEAASHDGTEGAESGKQA